MKKTILASALALGLSTASTANAYFIDIISGGYNDPGGQATGRIETGQAGDMFFGSAFYEPWTATTMAGFTALGAHTWAGISPQGAYSYNFTLAAGQVAFGTFFDWSVNIGSPVLAVFDCVGTTTGSACTGNTFNHQTVAGPDLLHHLEFIGTVSSVPLPPAVWLFGSGLLGLVGFARRKKA